MLAGMEDERLLAEGSDDEYTGITPNVQLPDLLERKRRRRKGASVIAAAVVIAFASLFMHNAFGLSSASMGALSYNFHIAVEEVAGYHGEVVAATLYAAQALGSRVSLFRDFLGAELDAIVGAYYRGSNLPTRALIPMLGYGPWTSPVIDLSAQSIPGPPSVKHAELSAENNVTLGAYFSAHPINVLLLSSCSESIAFQVICTIHHADRFTWGDKFFGLEQRGALKILTLNKAAQTFAYDRSMSYASTAGKHGGLDLSFDSVLIRAFAPIFPVPGLPSRPMNVGLDSVVVQGGLSQAKRDYAGIFSDIQGFLQEDASRWGYRYDTATGMYEEDATVTQPFKIHLIGSGRLAVPSNISKIAIVQSGLNYIAFYRLINSAQLLLPAFNLEGYMTTMASSSIAAGVLAMTPVLADNRIMRAYSYLNERNTVIKPFDMSDMQAVKRLKFGESLVEGRPNAKLGQWREDYWQLDVPSAWADRNHAGYARTQADIDAATRDIHRQNRKHLTYTIFN
ncbi:uncharacterized protein L969DRAFT_53258 [Mixia osmundae IAM 14324]|uniref:Uncharacterized protein n=1 Tax=Mixia osmundae (strain CBS 9802 / IAM 14324 / JCM 22182 / KY 12970) TaxID=764103 RepID=G7DV07_MIXOS|nr:uncharacterized protein L969DRAFT_53258 [Mixia osmundae IAM 14324]KEI37250.1 hypothetical protein L969DRAFT_53258 [Mixia osmundae IAM 14324]GAA94417.1 hypothetical protein E5Q_01069 [Mixia osmundae IAM 14324]